jgi:hypothetical protein
MGFAACQEPMRFAGAAMCAVFFLGLLALPFALETHGQPLPPDNGPQPSRTQPLFRSPYPQQRHGL